MRIVFLCWLCLLASLTMFSSANGAGKITVDPNRGNERAEAQDADMDARLAQEVTYEARHRAVKTILADLSDMTGITLRAGYNSKDWQVRDRKMTIYARDIPLAQLMSSIARVMKFKWSINHDANPWTCRLYMDRTTLLGADAELYRYQESFNAEVTRRRENFAEMIENWSDDISPYELAKLRKDNPYLYVLHTFGSGKALQGIFRDIPGAVDSFVNRERNMVVPVSTLSAETQQCVLGAAKMKFEARSGGAPFPDGAEQAFFAEGRLNLELVPREMSWDAVQYWDLAGAGVFINGRHFLVEDMSDPNSKMTQFRAEARLQARETGVPSRELMHQRELEAMLSEAEDARTFGDTILPEPVEAVDHPDEPALYDMIRVEADGKKLIDYEEALAEASGFAVVSDSFNVCPGFADIGKQEIELREVLTKLSDGYRYGWEKHGAIIEFRSKDWFMKRTTQIPDEWIDQWRASFKASDYLSIDDLAQMSILTNAQIEENLKSDAVFGLTSIFDWGFHGQRPILKLYSSLSPSQRRALFSKSGLSSVSLRPHQWELLAGLSERISTALGYSALLKGDVACDGKRDAKCTIQLVSAVDLAELGKWIVNLPRYKEQLKPQPKATADKDIGSASQPTSSSTSEAAK